MLTCSIFDVWWASHQRVWTTHFRRNLTYGSIPSSLHTILHTVAQILCKFRTPAPPRVVFVVHVEPLPVLLLGLNPSFLVDIAIPQNALPLFPPHILHTAYCIWSVVSSVWYFDWWSSSLDLSCYVPCRRDLRDWEQRLRSNDTLNTQGCTFDLNNVWKPRFVNIFPPLIHNFVPLFSTLLRLRAQPSRFIDISYV